MDYYDALETRESDQRERDQFEALRRQLAYAKANAPACFAILADIEPGDVVDRKSLSLLPVVRKSDLIGRQADNPPFGGLVTLSPENLGRVFQSPGPIYEPQSRRADYWRLARAMFAAGMRAGDLVHNAFSYHMTPAGSMFETGADALGCAVFPAGVGQTELQVRAMVDLQPSAYAGTPSFLNIVLDKVDEMAPANERGTIRRYCRLRAAMARVYA